MVDNIAAHSSGHLLAERTLAPLFNSIPLDQIMQY